MLNMKKTQILSGMILVASLILSTTVLAGGSIFGGHKTRTSNPNGVTSIGAYICSDLDCPPVRVINAKNCDEVEGTEKKWGVCLCKEDYIAKGNACIPCPGNASCETGKIVCEENYHLNEDGTRCVMGELIPVGDYYISNISVESSVAEILCQSHGKKLKIISRGYNNYPELVRYSSCHWGKCEGSLGCLCYVDGDGFQGLINEHGVCWSVPNRQVLCED